MTAFAPFQVRKRLGAIRGLLALICVCDNFHHAEPTLSLARPYVNRWPARLDTGSLEHELEFNSAQRRPIMDRHPRAVLRGVVVTFRSLFTANPAAQRCPEVEWGTE